MPTLQPTRAHVERVRRVFHSINAMIPQESEPNLAAIADTLDAALSHQPTRRLVLLSVADFMAQSVSGSVPLLESWQPPSF